MREIFFESARENAKVPVKIFKKVCVKNFFTREKMKKRPKNGFTHTFDFHAEKKNTAQLVQSFKPTRNLSGQFFYIYISIYGYSV